MLNTFCFAVYSLLQAKRPQQISQPTLLAATAFTGVIIILPFLFATVGEHKLIHLQPVDYGGFKLLEISSIETKLCNIRQEERERKEEDEKQVKKRVENKR